MAFYIDTSALAKLIVVETESEPLRDWVAREQRDLTACDLVRTELRRAVRRVAPDCVARSRVVLNSITLTSVTPAIFEEAGRLEPASLRPLDAIHLASALDLGDDLEALITYDERLAAAAEANGVTVLAPA